MNKLKYIKLFENFKINESIDNYKLLDNFRHMVKSSAKMEDESTVYLGQNIPAYTVIPGLKGLGSLLYDNGRGEYKLDSRVLEGMKWFALVVDKYGKTLNVIDYTRSNYLSPDGETKEQFLSLFNNYFKTECDKIIVGKF
jgi:hypothetical protein